MSEKPMHGALVYRDSQGRCALTFQHLSWLHHDDVRDGVLWEYWAWAHVPEAMWPELRDEAVDSFERSLVLMRQALRKDLETLEYVVRRIPFGRQVSKPFRWWWRQRAQWILRYCARGFAARTLATTLPELKSDLRRRYHVQMTALLRLMAASVVASGEE